MKQSGTPPVPSGDLSPYRRDDVVLELYRAIAEATSNIIVVTRARDETIVYVSPSVTPVAGYRPEDLVGRRVKDVYADPAEHTRHKAEIVKAGHVENSKILLKTATGAPIWAQANSRIFMLNGEPHIVNDLVDVAGRQHLVQAVMESEARFRDFTDTASDWLWETGADHRFTEVTGAAPLYGKTKVNWQAVGKTRTEIFAAAGGDIAAPEWRAHEEILARREPFQNCRYWLVDFNGNRRHVSVSGKPIFAPDGTFKGYRGTGRDITELMTAMDSLRAAKEEAEAASKAKSNFLSAMSHELRTPLNAILGFAELMRIDDETPVSEAHRDDLDQIVRSGMHLLELINEVLDLSKIEAGKLTMSPGAVSVRDLIAQCVPLVEPAAQVRKISIDASRAQMHGGYVRADPLRLKQVLLNLLSNAVKYNVDGGLVAIDCMDVAGGYCRIEVRDTGVGISAKDGGGIFEPFVRVGRSSAAAEGTGIGLSLSKRLIEMMDGEIGFDSVEGEGSTFWIRLPATEGVAAPQALPASAWSHAGGAWRVLYVEDDPINVKVMERVLARHGGIDLAVAHSAETAFGLIADTRPDVILMDSTLPGMSGIEAIAHLKGAPETRAIPIVSVSANAMDTDIRGALDAGAEAYVTKPLDFQVLLRTLSDVLAAR